SLARTRPSPIRPPPSWSSRATIGSCHLMDGTWPTSTAATGRSGWSNSPELLLQKGPQIAQINSDEKENIRNLWTKGRPALAIMRICGYYPDHGRRERTHPARKLLRPDWVG